MLSLNRILQLANKTRVNSIAVKNFLYTISCNRDKQMAILNMELDARLYQWNYETKNAIRQGIVEFFS